MKKTKLLFCFVMLGWATGAWGLAKSLLKPAEMPKVFADASFEERMQVLAEGYGEVATEYDENGVCVSGCAYKGMRIEDEERMIVRATDELRSLIEMENARMGYDPQQIQALQQQYLQQLQQKAQADAQAAGVQLEASGQAVAQQQPAGQQQVASQQQPAGQQQIASQQQTGMQQSTLNQQPSRRGGVAQQAGGQAQTQQQSPQQVAQQQTQVLQTGQVSGGGSGAQFFLGPPVGGDVKVGSDFGERRPPSTKGGKTGSRYHRGVDIKATTGTPLYAAADGKVIKAGWGGGGGNTVIVEHGFNSSNKKVQTVYMHMSKVDVTVGQTVQKGQKLGAAGNTGNSGGAHLHYSVRFDGVNVDPLGSRIKPVIDKQATLAGSTSGTNYLGAPYCVKSGISSTRLRSLQGNDAALRENFPQCTGWCKPY